VRVRALRISLVLRVVALATAASALALGAVGGRSYLWCEPMHEARLHCCCPLPDEDLADQDLVSVACCEPRTVADLPSGTDARAQAPVVPAPPPALPVVAMLEPPALDEGWLTAPSRRIALPSQPARAGPGRRLHARCSVYLL